MDRGTCECARKPRHTVRLAARSFVAAGSEAPLHGLPQQSGPTRCCLLEQQKQRMRLLYRQAPRRLRTLGRPAAAAASCGRDACDGLRSMPPSLGAPCLAAGQRHDLRDSRCGDMPLASAADDVGLAQLMRFVRAPVWSLLDPAAHALLSCECASPRCSSSS
jgi:hypothetical protein